MRLTKIMFALPFVFPGSGVELQAGDDQPTPQALLQAFQKSWQPTKGYMRPLKDEAWKTRFRSFQQLVAAGKKSVPAIVNALEKGNDDTRVFAAQALAFLAEEDSKPAAAKGIRDKHPAVRLYAIDTLSMFGRLKLTDEYKQIRDKDSNRDVRSHMKFALERDEDPQAEKIRKALREYDARGLDSAKLGKPAPDFALADPKGKKYRLSDWRGKKTVVLVFVYGDT